MIKELLSNICIIDCCSAGDDGDCDIITPISTTDRSDG